MDLSDAVPGTLLVRETHGYPPRIVTVMSVTATTVRTENEAWRKATGALVPRGSGYISPTVRVATPDDVRKAHQRQRATQLRLRLDKLETMLQSGEVTPSDVEAIGAALTAAQVPE